MRKTVLLLLTVCMAAISVSAQVNPSAFKPFMGKEILVSSAGPGLTQASGDILLELAGAEDDMERLLLLRKTNGKLAKIAANSGLLMKQDLLGVSGGNYPSLNGTTLSIDYTLGSNSSQSDISIAFEKGSDGRYYFKSYTTKTRNYGVEDLYSRKRLTVLQTGNLEFSEATESLIFDKAKWKPLPDPTDQPGDQAAANRYVKYVPEGWRLACFAEGDLNLDGFKKDLLLLLYNEDVCAIQLLLEKKGGGYEVAQVQDKLILPDETFNIENLKAVVKNGYFTIERRMPTDEDNFDHQYITFKYDVATKNWFLHRYDVEHYRGFDPKPSAKVTHLTKADFGTVSFKEMKRLPTDFYYEPAVSVLTGLLLKKQFFGRPNYGETPEKDEKVHVYVLKLDQPIRVLERGNPGGGEIKDKAISGVRELQVYSSNKGLDLSGYLNKRVSLKGSLFTSRTGGQYTKVVLQVGAVVR